MTKAQLNFDSWRRVREEHSRCCALADEVLATESELVAALVEIERARAYRRLGCRTIHGYCQMVLRFSRTQSQRLAIRVRRKLDAEL